MSMSKQTSKQAFKNLKAFIDVSIIKPNTKTETHQILEDHAHILLKIDENQYDTFMELYTKEITKTKIKYLTLAEKSLEVGDLYFDFDIKIENNTEKLYDDREIISIVKLINRILKKYYINSYNDDDEKSDTSDTSDDDVDDDETETEDDNSNEYYLTAYILTKPKPSFKKNSKNEIKYSYGFHIHYPNVILNEEDRFFVLNRLMIALKKNDFINRVIEKTNLKLNEILDESVMKESSWWYMYGSGKLCEDGVVYPYLLSYVVSRDDLVISASEYKKEDLIKKLSLRNPMKNNVLLRNPKYDFSEDKKNDKKLKAGDYFIKTEKKSEIPEFLKLSTDINVEKLKQINEAKELVKLLNENRSSDYKNWISVGWALCNISETLEEDFHEFSKKCENKYDFNYCHKVWLDALNYTAIDKKGYGIGSLCRWAKEDNPEEFKKFLSNKMNNMLNDLQDFEGEYQIAEIMKEMYGHEFVCSSINNDTWYHFNGRWTMNAQAHKLSILLSTHFAKECFLASKKLYVQHTTLLAEEAQAGQEKKNNQHDNLKEKADLLLKYAKKKLSKRVYKESLIKEAKILFIDEEFYEKLDDNNFLVGFNNGTYDLNERIFRAQRPEDYISFTVGYDYIERPEQEKLNDIRKFLDSILPEKDVQLYVMCYIASILEGGNTDQKLMFWLGGGGNGKGTLNELIDKTFGDYYATVDVSLLTQKRNNSSSASPQLADKKAKRALFLQEPDEGDSLQLGFMKSLTGEDKVQARPLYQDPFYFYPKFKISFLANQLPNINATDNGTWRRIRVIKFNQSFVDNPTKPNEQKADPTVRTKLKTWNRTFMWLLINEYYPIYKKEGLNALEPDSVKLETNSYKQDSDVIRDYFNSKYEICDDEECDLIPIEDFKNDFTMWIKQNSIHFNNKNIKKRLIDALICFNCHFDKKVKNIINIKEIN